MIYIRTDMNEIIASGHLMRCIAIAEAARALGEEALFFLADEKGTALLREHGFSFRVLGTRWDKPEDELPRLLPLLREERVGKLLVDSYRVTPEYLRSLSEMTRVYYIDDINAFHYPVQGLICYANYYEKFEYPKNYPEAELLLGTDYVPLRPEYRGLSQHSPVSGIRKVLITSGGSDPGNALGQILLALPLTRLQKVTAICGRYHPYYEKLSRQYRDIPSVHIEKALPGLMELMREADLAVSAGGTTLYELCACGTMTITYSMADNQLENVRRFEADGLMKYAGDVREEGLGDRVLRQFRSYEELSEEEINTLSRRLRKLVDGRGAERIARKLI